MDSPAEPPPDDLRAPQGQFEASGGLPPLPPGGDFSVDPSANGAPIVAGAAAAGAAAVVTEQIEPDEYDGSASATLESPPEPDQFLGGVDRTTAQLSDVPQPAPVTSAATEPPQTVVPEIAAPQGSASLGTYAAVPPETGSPPAATFASETSLTANEPPMPQQDVRDSVDLRMPQPEQQPEPSFPPAAVMAESPNAGLASGVPGASELEGQQIPQLALERIAPNEIQVGKPAVFRTFVRNVGNVTAHQVVVTDRVPQGTRFVDASPQYQQTSDGALAWHLGDLPPGEAREVALELMPEKEGEIGSVALLSFQGRASVRTLCTRPQLKIHHSTAESVLVGEEVVFEIEISNPGTGAATGIILEEDVPPGLTHRMGRELKHDVGDLQPGESYQLELVLAAEAAGTVSNVLRVRGDGDLFDEHRLQLEVRAPQLEVATTGPTRRYLERQGTYEISISNPGTAPARNVDLVAYLPEGLKFIEANHHGQYDGQNRAVYWSLEELPANQQGVVQLTALPVETGQQKLVVEARGDQGLASHQEHITLVEGVAQLQFTLTDVQDPIEVGSETTYEIRIVNQGSAAATNVRLGALLPDGVKPLGGDGPTRTVIEGQQALSDPLASLAPGADAVYRLRAEGRAAGDHVVRVKLASDEATTPVSKEEITRVYADH
jgi:uncharacterized repeat protein (TIGR01451 family)